MQGRAGCLSSRSTSRRANSGPAAGRYTFKKSGERDRTSDEMVAPLRGLGAAVSDRRRSKTASPKATGTAGSADERARRSVQLVGDDVFVTNPEILQARHRRRRRQRAAGEAESDRHGHRDARRGAHGARCAVRDDHLAPLGRDRRHHDRRPRRRDGGGPDQDRVRKPHRPRLQIQPAAAHRGGARRGRHVRRPLGDSRRSRNDQDSFCSATAKAPGTRKTGSPAGPMSICPTADAKKPTPPGNC